MPSMNRLLKDLATLRLIQRMLEHRRFRRTLRQVYRPGQGIDWVFHAEPGQPCKACTINASHYDTCTCGHCPPRPVGMVIHRRLSEVLHDEGLI